MISGGAMNFDRKYIAKILAGLIAGDNLKIDEPMNRHTSFKVGGPADILAVPCCTEELVNVYRTCIREKVPVLVIGNGTNLIVGDRGIRGVVIKLSDNLSKNDVRGDTICAEAGIPISRLSKIACDNGLSGLEFAEGIPGTLGGAVVMNAGAYTGQMADIVAVTDYMDAGGNVRKLDKEQHKFGKRASFIQTDGGIVLRAVLKLKKGNTNEIKEKMDHFNRQRREKQPLDMPSAGSIFKRPEGYYAGRLIQDCGLMGYRIGGAEVSTKHCGFIVNNGNATAKDIKDLILHIQQTVKSRFGVELQTEVKITGE